MDDTLRKRLAEKQGGGNQSKFPKYVVPIINFNGNTGEFRRTAVDDFGELSKEAEPIKSPVEVIVVKKRSAFASKMGADPHGKEYFSTEFSSPNDIVSLFSKINNKISFEGADKASALRTKFPVLKTKAVLYVLYEGMVHKLEVKGGSFSAFIDWQNDLREEDKHSFEVLTSLSSAKKKHEVTKKPYFAITFKSKELDTEDGIEEAMDEVNAAIKKQEEYQNSRQVAAPVEQPKEEEANPEDIPF